MTELTTMKDANSALQQKLNEVSNIRVPSRPKNLKFGQNDLKPDTVDLKFWMSMPLCIIY